MGFENNGIAGYDYYKAFCNKKTKKSKKTKIKTTKIKKEIPQHINFSIKNHCKYLIID